MFYILDYSNKSKLRNYVLMSGIVFISLNGYASKQVTRSLSMAPVITSLSNQLTMSSISTNRRCVFFWHRSFEIDRAVKQIANIYSIFFHFDFSVFFSFALPSNLAIIGNYLEIRYIKFSVDKIKARDEKRNSSITMKLCWRNRMIRSLSNVRFLLVETWRQPGEFART